MGLNCIVASIHDSGVASESFDIIYIFGGLHHVLPQLDEVVSEVHRLLKPGGHFFFVEPNKRSLLNVLRTFGIGSIVASWMMKRL